MVESLLTSGCPTTLELRNCRSSWTFSRASALSLHWRSTMSAAVPPAATPDVHSLSATSWNEKIRERESMRGNSATRACTHKHTLTHTHRHHTHTHHTHRHHTHAQTHAPWVKARVAVRVETLAHKFASCEQIRGARHHEGTQRYEVRLAAFASACHVPAPTRKSLYQMTVR